MKQFLFFSIACMFGTLYFTDPSFPDPMIDLPEEYPLISKDSLKPDTLLGWYKDNKLVFGFHHPKK